MGDQESASLATLTLSYIFSRPSVYKHLLVRLLVTPMRFARCSACPQLSPGPGRPITVGTPSLSGPPTRMRPARHLSSGPRV
eukprot:7664600-Heterocapsa_arctica.AAC.1